MDAFRHEIAAIVDWAREQGAQFERSADEIARFADETRLQLAEAAGDPAFPTVVRHAAGSVATFAGLRAVEEADRLANLRNAAFVRMIQGVFTVVAAL